MYTPILKWKLGEKKALQNLSDEVSKKIFPLFELQPCTDTEDLQITYNKFTRDLQQYWKHQLPFMLDFTYFDIDGEISDNPSVYFTQFIQASASIDYNCIPVIPSENYDMYIDSIQQSSSFFKNHGIAIRLNISSFDDATFKQDLLSFLHDINISIKNVTLIIDFKEINIENIKMYAVIFDVISTQTNLKEFKNVILIGTGYPSGFPSNYMESYQEKVFSRTELDLWRNLKMRSNNICRAPNIHFGDYCCNISAPMLADTSFMRPSAIIKYTYEEGWYIVRGQQLKKAGYSQYADLCKKIVNSNHYKGENFSHADKFIKDCSECICKPGNTTTWVQIATNHHITLVAQQFATGF